MPRARTAADRRAAAEARRARRAEVEDPDVVMEAAAAFLAVRPRSVEETRRRLRHLGYSAGLCDRVVDRLVEVGYLDDEAFARAWVESRDRARPRGAVTLRRELQSKGIAAGTITAVLAERGAADGADPGSSTEAAEEPDRRAARLLLERRGAALRREPDGRKRRQRTYALLARHGFSPDVCSELAATVGDAEPSGEPV